MTGAGVTGGTHTEWSAWKQIIDLPSGTNVTNTTPPVITTGTLVAGQTIAITAGTYTGTPTSTTLINILADDASGTNPVEFTLVASTLPTTAGGKYFRRTERVTGFGIATYLDTSTAWTAVNTAVLAAVAPAEWSISLVTPVGATDRLDTIDIDSDLAATAAYWTTSTAEQLDATAFPAGWEAMTLSSTSGGYQHWAVADANHGTPVKNYRIFEDTPADNLRRTRVRVLVTIGGVNTPRSAEKTLPNPPNGATRTWIRQVMRKEGQFNAGEIAGSGYQFPRSYSTSANDPNFVFCGVDISMPFMTRSFGDFWETPDFVGLRAGESTAGTIVDSGDANRVLVMYSACSLNAYGTFGAAAGIYRSLDKGATFTQVQALADVYGTNNSPLRCLVHYMCEAPGGTPDTRTYYAIHAPAAFNSGTAGFGALQLYKANANGGSSWATDGGTLAIGTYGVPFGLQCKATGTNAGALYLHTQNGVWRRPAGSSTWTAATGLPSGDKRHLEVVGNTVYVAVKGASGGLYSAPDATTLAFTRLSGLGAYNIVSFSVSKANTSRILVCGAAGVLPKWSWDGGATWGNISSHLYDGQTNDFDHKIHNEQSFFMWHETDPDLVLAMRFHHLGKSVDGGKNFFWSSRGYDYSVCRGIGFHPTDYTIMALPMTDRLLTYTDTGGDWVNDDSIGTTEKTAIEVAVNGGAAMSSYSGSGGIVLTRNSHIGVVAGCGDNGMRTPIIHSMTVTQPANSATGTGNGTLTGLSAAAGQPSGTYKLSCTTAATNGGTFTLTSPTGTTLGTTAMGAFTIGGISGTLADGSTDFSALPASRKVFSIYVNPIGACSVLNPAQKGTSFFGQVSPSVTYRGCVGCQRWIMSTGGVITQDATWAYEFVGYGGTGGAVIFGVVVNDGSADAGKVYRSTSEGGAWSVWYTPASTGNDHSFRGRGNPAIAVSTHNAERVYIGTKTGRVRLLQGSGGSPTATVIFDFKTVMASLYPSVSGWAGYPHPSGGVAPPIMSITESAYDPNLLYCSVLHYGGAAFFRTTNALGATPVWEDITADGMHFGGYQIYRHPLTDEIIATGTHGTTVYKPPAAHRTAYSITTSVFDRIEDFLGDSSLYVGV